jgi:hypothetical protein
MARGQRLPERVENLPGSSLEAEFGGTGGGVRESPISQATGSATAPTTTGSQSAPAKASLAPGKSKDVFTGLCDGFGQTRRVCACGLIRTRSHCGVGAAGLACR